MQIEIWKDIPDYEGRYQISNLGTVKSLRIIGRRKCGLERTHKDKILKPRLQSGYLVVCLCSPRGKSIRKEMLVHRLIAQAFIPNIENKPCVNHIDNNRINNNISNLEWCTHQENISKHFANNDKKFKMSLKYEHKIQMREMKASGWTIKDLAKYFNCSEPNIMHHINKPVVFKPKGNLIRKKMA